MKNYILRAIPAILLLVSCKKDDVQNHQPILPPAKGVYVLSEGAYNGNNTKLAFRSNATSTVYPDFFVQQNPAQSLGLGDTGNDMLIYGGKLYIVMNNSGNVTVLDAATGTFLTRISFLNGTVNKSPRYALGTRGKVFVTAYDNTVSVIDTTSLSIVNSITVGSNPEYLVTAGNFLYVANSGGLNYPNVDSTVSVIDLNTQAEVRKVTVGLNPQRLAVNDEGDIWVSGYGDAFAATPVPAFVKVIDGFSHEVIPYSGASLAFDHLRIYNNQVFLFNNYGGSNVKLIDATTRSVIRENFITDGTVITNLYAVDIDDQNGDVFICDSKDFTSAGEVFCFDQSGRKKYSFNVSPGVNPNKVVFLR